MHTTTLLALCLSTIGCSATETYRVYIGTYTAGTQSKGIYRFDLDARTGTATEPVVAAEATNPAFVAIHPSGKFLYAVGEVGQFKGQSTGSVSAYAVEEGGNLRPLNTEASGGGGPCHLVVDPSGRNVLVANYGGGSVACLPIEADGRLKGASAFVQHKGASGVNKQRQEAPHAHSINPGPDGKLAFVADLGQDKIQIYKFDAAAGTLTPHGAAATPPGGGPRHLAFHPSGKFAYTNNEMTSAVTAMRYDGKTGTFEPIQTLSTLPSPVEGNSTAEVVVHPSGRFLYVSNRGHDSLAIFTIDEKTGELTAAGHAPTGGKVPRNFAITPDGRWLLAANQESNNIVIFKVDPATGGLTATGQTLAIPKPVCVRFLAQ